MRINASQVHEARMIATHAYKLFKRFEKKKPVLRSVRDTSGSGLLCAPCLRKDLRTEAITIFDSSALCHTHLWAYNR